MKARTWATSLTDLLKDWWEVRWEGGKNKSKTKCYTQTETNVTPSDSAAVLA
jgi:hypothetical protein